jgi:hypothetical protein
LVCVPDGIDHEIRQDLIDPRAVGNDEDRLGRKVGHELQTLGGCQFARAVEEAFDQ